MWKWIKKIGRVALEIGGESAGAVAGAYLGPLGKLVEIIAGHVIDAEAEGGTGDEKRGRVRLRVEAALPLLFGWLEDAGKGVVNVQLVMGGIAKIQEGVVDVLNGTGRLAKQPTVEVE